jgi:hypothetical protein
MVLQNFGCFPISRYKSFSIIMSIAVLLSFSLTIFSLNSNVVFATTTENEKDSKDSNDKEDKFHLQVNINLNNIIQAKPQLFKVVAFINGEIQTKVIDVKKNATISKTSMITVPFEFNKKNDVSATDAGDEYFACGYVLKSESILDQSNPNSNNNKPMIYDCNESRLASPDKGSPNIFSALNKYDTSVSMYQSAVNAGVHDSNEIKIILTNPTSVIEHLDNAIFVAMVKGDYQIKKINIKDEIEKSKDKDVITVPFTFKTNTEIGPIQIGDFFFGCITAGGYSSSENSECENRNIKHFDKPNELPVAH